MQSKVLGLGSSYALSEAIKNQENPKVYRHLYSLNTEKSSHNGVVLSDKSPENKEITISK